MHDVVDYQVYQKLHVQTNNLNTNLMHQILKARNKEWSSYFITLRFLLMIYAYIF